MQQNLNLQGARIFTFPIRALYAVVDSETGKGIEIFTHEMYAIQTVKSLKAFGVEAHVVKQFCKQEKRMI